MLSLPDQNKDRNLLSHFLRSIQYQHSSGNKTYGDALSILREIFEASGQQHLLYLVKLRKLWFDKIDSFLARNSYPRNISVLRQFTVDSDFIQELCRVKLSADFLQAVEKLTGESFKRSEQFNLKLQKKLKRLLTAEETELLKNKVRFKAQQTILHLTVYDGSIAQALRFETEAYLRMFHRLLPELKLDTIRCHVGDLGQSQYDQSQVALLAKEWQIVTPEAVHQNSMPAFIHRVSRVHAILVLYVSSQQALELLKRNPGADWLVQHLHKKLPELADVLHKIAFVPKPELNLEQVRLRSFVLGDIPPEKISDEKDVKSISSTEDSTKNELSAKEQFAKISMKLKEQPSDSDSSC